MQVLALVKQHLPLGVLAVLCIWGYVDLKTHISRLGATGEGEAAESEGDAPAASELVERTLESSVESLTPSGMETPSESQLSWECSGKLEHEQIMETVGKYGQGIFECYKEVLRTNPELSGTLAIELNVAPDGTVQEARVQGKVKEPELLECVSASVYSWLFTAPAGDGCALVMVPFLLRPEDHLEEASSGPAPGGAPAAPVEPPPAEEDASP